MFFILLSLLTIKFTIKSYKLRKIPRLTLNQVIKRNRFARWWRQKSGILKKRPMMFSDEKMFCVHIT